MSISIINTNFWITQSSNYSFSYNTMYSRPHVYYSDRLKNSVFPTNIVADLVKRRVDEYPR